MHVTSRVIVVTGGAEGIGRALVERFHSLASARLLGLASIGNWKTPHAHTASLLRPSRAPPSHDRNRRRAGP